MKKLRKISKKELVINILRDLKREGWIRDFITLYSVRKPDFYITYISKSTNTYKWHPLSVHDILNKAQDIDSVKRKILKRLL